MNATNTINNLFHIPDEGSFLKKLILGRPLSTNSDIPKVFELLKQHYDTIDMVQNQDYYSLMLPAQSPGVKIEAMLITTIEDGKKYFSIYHRIHFDPKMYGEMSTIIEADAFLRLSAVVINIPIDGHIEGLASLLNYQIQEALNIEITMLSLADADDNVPRENIVPFVMNAVGRSMLASALDDVAYQTPTSVEMLGRMIANYCDIPLVVALEGIEKLEKWQEDVDKSEDAFIAEYASSTSALMFLLLEKRTSTALLENGTFKTIKEFIIDKAKYYELESVKGLGETLGEFTSLTN